MEPTNTSSTWPADFESMQRQYWAAWTNMAKKATNVDALKPPMQWHEGLEQWSRMFAGSSQQNDVVEKMLASTKQYLAMMQSVFGTPQNQVAASFDNSPAAWTALFRNGFNVPGMDSRFFNNPIASAMHDMAAQTSKGFEEMQSMFAPWADSLKQETLKTLHMPTFGHDREQQEKKSEFAAAWIEYQEALNDYNALMFKVSQQGFSRFETKLAEHSEPGRQLSSMRAIYDVWVDAVEEAYAETALSPEFRKAYGKLVNAQTRVRALVQEKVEQNCAAFGIPTRTEINAMGKTLQDLRRQLKQRSEGESNLAKQVAALHNEVAALKERAAAKPASASSMQPSAAKASTTNKR